MTQFGSDVVVGTVDAFVLGSDSEGEGFQDQGLYRVPLSGAAVTQMKSFIDYESPMLIGTVDNDVIYTPDRNAIVRTSSTGDTTLAMNADLATWPVGCAVLPASRGVARRHVALPRSRARASSGSTSRRRPTRPSSRT